MQISISGAARLLAERSKLAATSAMLVVAMLIALSTELSHAHEDHEQEFECEICLDFSFSDDLIIASTNSEKSQIPSRNNSDLIVTASDSLAVEANSRAPPQV